VFTENRDCTFNFPQRGLGSATGHVGAVEELWKKFCVTISTGLRNTPSNIEENARVAALSSLADVDWGPL
jgi:hypothetical protein